MPIPGIRAALIIAVVVFGTTAVLHHARATVETEGYTRASAGEKIPNPVSLSFRMNSGQYGEGELDGVTGIQIEFNTTAGMVTDVIPFSNENQYPTYAPLAWSGSLPVGARVEWINLRLVGGPSDGDDGTISEEGGFTIAGPVSDQGRTDLYPQDVKMTLLPSDCATNRNIHILLHARDTSQMILPGLTPGVSCS